MKVVLKLLSAVVLATLAFGQANAMSIKVGWADGTDTPIFSDVPVSPNYFVGDPRSVPAFTNTPPLGRSFSYWMRRTGNLYSPAWSRANDFLSDVNPLIATYDDTDATTTFYLVARVDWYGYNLSFDTLGGSNSPTNETLNLIYTNRVSFAAYTGEKKGYRFEGWTNSLSATAAPLTGAFTVDGEILQITNANASVTLAAKWQGVGYALDYDLGGGEFGAQHPNAAVYGVPFAVSNPTRLGYDFVQWTVLTNGVAVTSVKPVSGETTFLNLADREGAAVTLRADWTGKTVTVRFNNNGASSGSVAFEEKNVIFGSSYEGVNPPKKDGASFAGYYVDTSWQTPCWDRNGQPSNPTWDIPTNLTVIAQWEVSQLWIKYALGEGVSGHVDDLLADYDAEVKLSDGAGLSKAGCELLGWAANETATVIQYELGGTYRFTQDVTLYPVWKYLYYVAFDGHGATSGKMEVQEFVRGVPQSLTGNAFAKTGYSFAGWATNAASAAALIRQYDDGAVPSGLDTAPGATNTLWAVWMTNTYFVAFDPGNGSGEMPVQQFTYDQPVNLAKCTFAPPSDLYAFACWTNLGTSASFADEAEVLNLCSEPNATNRLTAVWELDVGEWSKAMHCTTGRWLIHNADTDIPWVKFTGPEYGKDGSRSCVGQDGYWYAWPPAPGDQTKKEWLSLEVKTNGTLSLWCKWQKQPCFDWLPSYPPALGIAVSKDPASYCNSVEDWHQDVPVVAVDDWTNIVVHVQVAVNPETGKAYLHLASRDDQDNILYIDQVTWTPDGTGGEMPGPGDAPTVTGLTFENGKLKLTATSAVKFDYRVLASPSLVAPILWTPVEATRKGGSEGSVLFELTPDPLKAQEFYKVEVLQKQ